MSELEKIGVIDGCPVYVDTGIDQLKIVRDAIRQRVNAKELKPGQRFHMVVDFGQRLQIDVTPLKEVKLNSAQQAAEIIKGKHEQS